MLTRRTLLLSTALPVVTALLAIDGRNARAAPTISMQQADYQYHPLDGLRCGACCMFVPGDPDRCTMIEGAIDPNGWCKYYEPGAADTCS